MQIMNDITDNQREFMRQWCSFDEVQQLMTSCRLNLSSEMINVIFNVLPQSRIKLRICLLALSIFNLEDLNNCVSIYLSNY